jgi:transcriptional regulator of acetoin/glycerol metabolism
MRKLRYQKEVLASWKKCMEGGVAHTTESPIICILEKDLRKRQEENFELISAFQYYVGLIEDLIPLKTAFLLADVNGMLLKKNEWR